MSAGVAPELGDEKLGLAVAIEERYDQPGIWSVEAIDMKGDGSVFQAYFVGPQARERAEEYAHFKYGQ